MSAGLPASAAIPRATLSDHVAAAIVDMIHREGLQPGDAIPSESKLAEHFGVNKLVAREAIRTLSAREIVQSSQGRVATVTLPSPAVLAQSLEFRLRCSALSFEELLVFRRLVEGELAAEAAGSTDENPQAVADAQQAIAAMRQRQQSVDEFIAADVAFHRAVARLGRNQLLALLLESIEGILLDARRSSYEGRARRGKGDRAVIRAHERVLAAILDGNAEAARRAMHTHLDETARDLRANRPA